MRKDYIYFYLTDKRGRKHYRECHEDEAYDTITLLLEENANKGGQGVHMYDDKSDKWIELCYYNTLD